MSALLAWSLLVCAWGIVLLVLDDMIHPPPDTRTQDEKDRDDAW